MALFISNLAFKGDADLINPAKLGILMGSTLAGIIGFTLLYWTLPRK
jgi:NhaA family Na+:H+ antiporter